MKCPKCRTENSEGAKFCMECGQALGATAALSFSMNYTAPQSYTPKFLGDKILTSKAAIEGERKLVTVSFADAAGFTSLSEHLDPEEVQGIMDG